MGKKIPMITPTTSTNGMAGDWSAHSQCARQRWAFALVPLLVLGYVGWYYYGAKQLDRTLYSLNSRTLRSRLNRLGFAATLKRTFIASIACHSCRYSSRRQLRRSRMRLKPTSASSQRTTFAKLSGGKVQIDVTYRQPAAMVYVQLDQPAAVSATKPTRGFYAIDDEAWCCQPPNLLRLKFTIFLSSLLTTCNWKVKKTSAFATSHR